MIWWNSCEEFNMWRKMLCDVRWFDCSNTAVGIDIEFKWNGIRRLLLWASFVLIELIFIVFLITTAHFRMSNFCSVWNRFIGISRHAYDFHWMALRCSLTFEITLYLFLLVLQQICVVFFFVCYFFFFYIVILFVNICEHNKWIIESAAIKFASFSICDFSHTIIP